MATLQFIPNTSQKGGSTLQLSLDDIPQEVRNDIEEAYKVLKTNPGRMRANFPSIAELNAYITQAKAYCELRPDGAIRFRKSPSKGLPPTSMDFRITDVQTENEAEVASINESVEAVKTAAKGK
jgi:hypothetical protein